MNYQFPEIRTIDDVLPSIKDFDEFKVIEKDGYTVIDYVFVDKHSFDDIMRRECRGIIFDRNGYLISRPFHKFFNLGEREETQPEKIDLSKKHEVLIKADGSMIRPVMLDGSVVPMTRKGLTDVAKQSWDEAFDTFSDEDLEIIFDWLDRGFTPIFEFVSPTNKIVIEYEKPEFILLGCRHNLTGGYTGIVSSTLMTHKRFDDARHLQEHTRSLDEKIEGYVVRFDDGHMIKIKTDEYLRLHKVIDAFESEKNILGMILNDGADDLYPTLEDHKANQLLSFEMTVNNRIQKIATQIRQDVERESILSQREFAEYVQKEIPRLYQPLYFQIRKGGEEDIEIIRKYLLKYIGSATKIEQIRDFTGPSWETYKSLRFETSA